MAIFDRLRNIINRSSGNFSLQQKRILRKIYGIIGDSIDLALSGLGVGASFNQLIYGEVIWLTGLTFQITECKYVIDGITYTSAAQQVTLSAADATNPRIDVFYANSSGVSGVLEGTAAASPAKPEVDPTTQVEISFALVEALATTPSGVANTTIYDEDDDWTTAVSAATIAKADTTDPYAGTKHVSFTAAKGANITFDGATLIQAGDYDKLIMYIKPVSWGADRNGRARGLIFTLQDGTTTVSDPVIVYHGQYSFDATSGGAYQLVAIPLADFKLTGAFDRVTISPNSQLTAYLDDMELQSGLTSNTPAYALLGESNAFTAAQGSSIQTLTDGANIDWDCGVANVATVTLDGNRTMNAPSNVIPGFTYILQVKQDATTGSRTITWNAVFKWAGGTAPTLSTTAGAVDIISFWADESGNLHGTLGIADSQ